MNKKNKKNKNKPPNPVPPQDKDSSEIVETNPQVEEKVEERVPEIVSEVVSPESKESDNENPKKPKRNRGKKKKEETNTEAKDEAQEKIEADPEATLAPACRKKKGKPKPDAVPETAKGSVENVDIVDSPKSPEPEEGKSRKKKKNKKRTDSERSEKAEEVSCTAAFQKILQPPEPRADKNDTKTDNNKETKAPEPNIEESIKSESKLVETKRVKDVKTVPEPKKVEDSAKPDPKQVKKVDETPKVEPKQAEAKAAIPLPPPPPPQEFLTRIQPIAEKSDSGDGFEEQKGKKKKKDKKYPKELEEQDLITALILGEAKVDVPSIFDKKLEARKAVERKQSARKEDIKETASKEGTVKDLVSLKDITEPAKTESQKQELEKAETPSLIGKQDVILLKYKEEEVAEVKKTETQTADKEKDIVVNLPKETVTVEEQLKKETKVEESSPKTRPKIAKPVEKKNKNKQQAKTPEPVLDNTETKIDVKPDIKPEEKCELKEKKTITPEQPVQKQKPVEIITADRFYETKFDDKQPSADEVIKQILEESISMEAKAQATKPVDDKKDTLDTEKTETGKRHRKSPKPQRKGGKNDKPVTPEPTEIKIQVKSETTKEPADVTKEPENKVDPEKTFAPIPDEISLSDIEKDVSFTSDITPDQIEPPRSASEQLLDPNNNTVIQEITTTTLAVTVTIPDTPFITSSEEPLKVEMSAGVIVTEVESPVPKDEKTDLKSKVLEVNQDMEELRLSIERSLAEFNVLEKEEISLKKRDDLIIVTCAKVETEVTSEPLVIDTTKLSKIDEVQEKSPDVQADELMKALTKPAKSEELEKVSTPEPTEAPIAPQRKENKGKNKSKKKGKQETAQGLTQSETTTTQVGKDSGNTQETKTEEKSDKQEKSDTKEEGKKQADADTNTKGPDSAKDNTAPIDNFEDAMTSSVSVDDVNQTFEILANACEDETSTDTKEDVKESPLSQPKNLLGHPDIPAPSNKTDYKKERNKTPNTKQAKVKIKDAVDIEKTKSNKECQTLGKPRYGRNKTINETVTCVTNENEEYVYKYSFRKVFLSNICHVCKSDLKGNRVPCSFCYLIFYCNEKHREEDVAQHSDLCFAISTIAHLKGQKHIYADAAGTSGHSYRLLRMQAIISAEKILKRRLEPWEQEALLYPRVCAEPGCREWRQGALADCAGCGQVSFCSSSPEHLPKIHARWCKSYSLYQKLVVHQLTRGRLEPRLPNNVLTRDRIPDNINRLLADLYDEKIELSDIQYASLTQLATAPLTAAHAHQLYRARLPAAPGATDKRQPFTIHVVGAELQFEADALGKWETFFLHLRPDVEELLVVLVGAELNPSNLPLDLLGKIKLCARCRVERRRLKLRFHDRTLYHDYCRGPDYIAPDIVCAFNPSIHRSTNYIRNDSWSPAINCILRSKKPFLITSYTMTELQRDVAAIKKCSEEKFNFVSEPKFNPFASVRPDRNFISDDEMPLLFKNYCYTVLIGAF